MNKMVSMRSETKSTEKSPEVPFSQVLMSVYFRFLDVKIVLNLRCVDTAVRRDMTAFLEVFRSPYASLCAATNSNSVGFEAAVQNLERSASQLGYGSDKVTTRLLPALPRLTRDQLQAIRMSPTTTLYLSADPANHRPLVAAGVHIRLGELLGDLLATPRAKQWAAEALFNLSTHQANHRPLVVAGVHNQLMALLVDPEATPGAKEYAAEGLFNLTTDGTNRGRLVADGVHIPFIKALIDDLQTTTHSKEWAARVIINLLPDDGGEYLAGSFIQFTAFLDDLKDPPNAKEFAARALWNLSANPANRQRLVDAGLNESLRALLDDPNATNLAKQYAAYALFNLNKGSCSTTS